jgi:TnpA family transposase
MASIERTAYPRLKDNTSQKELCERYTLSLDEISQAYSAVRGDIAAINYLVLLKCFQNVGYFPSVDKIPEIIIRYIQKQINVEHQLNKIEYNRVATLYSHHKSIREYLNVKQYDDIARKMVIDVVSKNSYVMENPADLINSAIDVLIKNNYELPAFSHLDKITLEVRASIHNSIFEAVFMQTKREKKKVLDTLLEVKCENKISDLQYLKEPAKKTSFKNMKELITKLNWLDSLEDFKDAIKDIPYSKLKHFSSEVYALDISEIKDYSDPKKYTMLISFLHTSAATLRDNLIDMFLKCVNAVTNKGQEELKKTHDMLRPKTENIVSAFTELLDDAAEIENNEDFGKKIRSLINEYGGQETLYNDCVSINSYRNNNYYVFLHKLFIKQRSNIFKLFNMLEFGSTTEDQSLITALNLIKTLYSHRKRVKQQELIKIDVDLSFAGDNWRKTVIVKKDSETFYQRSHLESCIFTCLAVELKCGDVYVKGSENYSDYREQLLPWEECIKEIPEYCKSLGLSDTANSFVDQLKDSLTRISKEVDQLYPENKSLVIETNGKITLKKYPPKNKPKRIKELEEKIHQLLPERSILEILCNTQHWVNWTRHFSPISGSDPKLENAIEKYILLTFTYGSNLGPVQVSKHLKEKISAHIISYLNSRHSTCEKLDASLWDLVNLFNTLELPGFWGTGKHAAVDGTMVEMYKNNIISEYHIRYGRNGGIMFHLLSDMYIALMGTFIPCGAWEAIYLLDLFIKNKSDIQPDTIHGDTQEQSGTVFALSYLLGVNLMPRIRNWKDLTFFRPDKSIRYKHIDCLFKETIDWNLIKMHWKDMFQVVISIKEGKILPSTLLKKLNNKSRKNRLFHAFKELGMAVRTIFLLKYIIDMNLRQHITADTNKVEAYNGFVDWIRFGGDGIVASNNPVEQEKRIKYTEVIANAIILHNTVDMTNAINQLIREGYEILKSDIESMSPLTTKNLKRYGVYDVDVTIIPEPIQHEILKLINLQNV